MYNANVLLENAIMEIVNQHIDEIINKIELEIKIEDIEKIVSQKEFLLLNRISEILSEDTDDFEVVEKIVELFQENNIDCGGRHDF